MKNDVIHKMISDNFKELKEDVSALRKEVGTIKIEVAKFKGMFKGGITIASLFGAMIGWFFKH